jgi:endonuclease YncB( thermonuclease family)
VVDGDTVRVSAKIWVDQRVSVAVRLKGVDAPELFKPQCEAEKDAARKAKAFVEEIVGGGVRLLEIEHDKYGGRVVARLETDGGTDVGAALVAKGLATVMGAPDPWCP